MKNVNTRRKAYGVSFLISGLAVGGIGLLTLWTPDLISSVSMKIILTLIIVAALSAVLFMLTFANDEDMVPQKMSIVIGGCSVALSVILIGEIWFEWLEGVLLGKLVFTLLIIGGLAGFVMSVWEDFFESKRLKDEGYLD